VNDNVSIVTAGEAVAVAFKGDLMLSAADELKVITGCMDAASWLFSLDMLHASAAVAVVAMATSSATEMM